MPDLEITETTDESVDVSRWTNYGKDRLYINKLGKSWDDFYVDLDGDEGHGTPMVRTDIEVDGSVVTVSWTRPNQSERRVVVDLDPSTEESPGLGEPTAEHIEEKGYNQAAGEAQQAAAQGLFSEGQ